jgi:hypothetical protein
MPGVYLADVIGDGTRPNAFRANIPRNVVYGVLMLDRTRLRALIVAVDSNLVGTGIVSLLTAASFPELRTAARGNLNGGRRTTVFNALRSAGWDTPAGTTWIDVIHGFARRIEPAADLDRIQVG